MRTFAIGMRYADVILPVPLDGTFTYQVPATLQGRLAEGMRVLVPFGRQKKLVGIVARLHDTPPQEGFQVKEVAEVLDAQPLLLEHQLRQWRWISDYYMAAPGDVMKAALPPGLKAEEGYRPRTETYIRLSEAYRSETALHIALSLLARAPKQQHVFITYLQLSGWDMIESEKFSSSGECRVESVEFPTGVPSPEGTAAANSTLYTLHSTLRYEVDWQDFEAKCADEKTTLFLLCNPHNPCGRVWTRQELQRMNDICQRHGVIVVSDEIHCELIMPGHTFVPFGTVTDRCVVMNSPSKSFNTAGLQIANIICPDPTWRRRIDRAININEVCDVNPFGIVALQAAYNESEDWIDQLNLYLWDNYQALCRFFAERLPRLTVCRLEGTYLVWVDVSALGTTVDQLCERLLTEGHVWVNPGTMYGPQTGEGYLRLNIACPRSQMMEGLHRMERILKEE